MLQIKNTIIRRQMTSKSKQYLLYFTLLVCLELITEIWTIFGEMMAQEPCLPKGSCFCWPIWGSIILGRKKSNYKSNIWQVCRSAYTPCEYVTLNEKLESPQGQYSFSNEPAKYEIKIQALVDFKTFYTCHMEIYTRKYISWVIHRKT